MKKIRRPSGECFIQLSGNHSEGRGTCVITRFNHCPFPLKSDTQKKNFFDINQKGRLGHTSKRGGIYWEKQTYSDNKLLIAIPEKIDPQKEINLVIFLHGNQCKLERDLIQRQRIPQQVFASNTNSILIAPQLAKDALDSSGGNFELENFAAQFIQESFQKISSTSNQQIKEHHLKKSKITLIAYSGGYLPAARILEKGGIDKKIKGIVLLDALYGEEEKFLQFIQQHKKIFLFSCFTEPARQSNTLVANQLNQPVKNRAPLNLPSCAKVFIQLNTSIRHQDLLTQSWIKYPVKHLLKTTSLPL